MTLRAARLGAALAALVLAAHQARTWWAEQAFEAGNFAVDPATGEPATAQPDRDVPGRLDAYLAAAERDPSQPAYALHAAQILMHRATRRPAPPDAQAQVARARALLERTADEALVDSEQHLVLAHALVAARDTDGAVRHLRAAIRCGPRRMSTLEPAVALLAYLWRATRDPDLLVDIVAAAARGYELSDGRDPALPPLGRVFVATGASAFFASPSGPALDDLLLAVRGRPDLAETAARLVEKARPEDARALRAAAVEDRRR